MNKTEQQLNVLAQNMGLRIGMLEGEKAILQVELQEMGEHMKLLMEELEELKQENMEVDEHEPS